MRASPLLVAAAFSACWASSAQAEMLALVNFESKPPEALKSYKSSVPGETRQEGIAVIDVDPTSETFGRIDRVIDLPEDLVAHHIFYNRDSTKAYVTALGKGHELRVLDMTDPALPMKIVDAPGCEVAENVVFSEDNTKWYLTCMGSGKVIVGDAIADKMTASIDLPTPYPHGIAVHDGIDRILVSDTVRHTDLGDAGERIVEVEASTGKVLGTHLVGADAEDVAPVEVLFVPNSDPAVAYVTNMYGGTLSAAVWNPDDETFSLDIVYDFGAAEAGVPLELYFDDAGETMWVTTAKPGHVHQFDISGDPAKPELVHSIATAEGAHHVAFTKDMKTGFVQNSLLNLPGMSDGSITVVDFEKGEAIASIDTFKEDGFNPNCIVLLPEWNHLAGH